jgi:thioredoxin 1
LSSVKITDDSFENDVLKSGRPVLVDFWAEWCGPCKQIGPALEEISDEMGNSVIVAKLNIDDNPMTPGRYGVRGIPTLMLFKDGKVAATKVGAMPKSQIQAWLNESVTSDQASGAA